LRCSSSPPIILRQLVSAVSFSRARSVRVVV
jgi:hypothetical protein